MRLAVLLYFLVCVHSAFATPTQELKLALSISNSSQRTAYYTLIEDFENTYPSIKVNLTSYSSEIYKNKFPYLLDAQQFDVLYWHSGLRLKEFIQQGKIAPLQSVVPHKRVERLFDDKLIDSVNFANQAYALPLSYYQIGFYYNKSLFAKLELEEPNNWQDFLNLCKSLKNQGIPPIYIGTKTHWSATAWFDYLNLRINGKSFHSELMQGKASFLDDRMRQVLEKLQQLSQAGYFIANHHQLNWKQGLPLLYRGLTGMTLVGNFVTQDIPESIKDQIGFYKFPLFSPNQGYYETTPLDVLVVANSSPQKKLAATFLEFVAQPNNQQKLNDALGVLSPHKAVQPSSSSLVQEAYETIANAQEVAHFFDRNSHSTYAERVMPLFAKFFHSPNITETQLALEDVRVSLFSTKLAAQHSENNGERLNE
ncbi:ABC transporter substrate-binding protein [Paraglaciecola aestuariivivens]